MLTDDKDDNSTFFVHLPLLLAIKLYPVNAGAGDVITSIHININTGQSEQVKHIKNYHKILFKTRQSGSAGN